MDHRSSTHNSFFTYHGGFVVVVIVKATSLNPDVPIVSEANGRKVAYQTVFNHLLNHLSDRQCLKPCFSLAVCVEITQKCQLFVH